MKTETNYTSEKTQAQGDKKAAKITKRALQAIETRNRIYETAVKIMEEDGFKNMTVGRISEAANVSVGAFYHHFKSKDNILDEAFDRADAYFEKKVLPNLEGATAIEKVLNYLCHYAEFNSQRGVDHIKALFATQSPLFNDKNRFMISGLQQIISGGIQNGEIKSELDSEAITEFLFYMVRGIMFGWCTLGGAFSLVESVRKYVTLQLRLFSP